MEQPIEIKQEPIQQKKKGKAKKAIAKSCEVVEQQADQQLTSIALITEIKKVKAELKPLSKQLKDKQAELNALMSKLF